MSVRIGEIYEDAFFHPCLCLGIDEAGFVWGVSLVDGSYPRATDIHRSGVRRLTVEEAWEWKMKGPERIAVEWGAEHPEKQ